MPHRKRHTAPQRQCTARSQFLYGLCHAAFHASVTTLAGGLARALLHLLQMA